MFTLLTSHVCFASKRRTSVTQTLVVMAGSAQKQMVHISVPVWKDTRESTAKVNFLPASSSISTTASRMHVVTMVTVFDKQRTQERSIKLKLWPMFYSGRQKQDIACKQLKTILPSPRPLFDLRFSLQTRGRERSHLICPILNVFKR